MTACPYRSFIDRGRGSSQLGPASACLAVVFTAETLELSLCAGVDRAARSSGPASPKGLAVVGPGWRWTCPRATCWQRCWGPDAGVRVAFKWRHPGQTPEVLKCRERPAAPVTLDVALQPSRTCGDALVGQGRRLGVPVCRARGWIKGSEIVPHGRLASGGGDRR